MEPGKVHKENTSGGWGSENSTAKYSTYCPEYFELKFMPSSPAFLSLIPICHSYHQVEFSLKLTYMSTARF